MQLSHLIVGLGNPGRDYEKTRHNVGFMAIDVLAKSVRATPWQKKFKGEIATATIDGHGCLLLKPATYMNLSGESVGEAAHFYKLDEKNIIVIHDDLDLVPGQIKVKQGGGSAGHNGLKSIDAHVGNATWRLRIGIGHPEDREQVTSYVLNAFSKADQTWLAPLLDKIAEQFTQLLTGETALFMQKMKS